MRESSFRASTFQGIHYHRNIDNMSNDLRTLELTGQVKGEMFNRLIQRLNKMDSHRSLAVELI